MCHIGKERICHLEHGLVFIMMSVVTFALPGLTVVYWGDNNGAPSHWKVDLKELIDQVYQSKNNYYVYNHLLFY